MVRHGILTSVNRCGKKYYLYVDEKGDICGVSKQFDGWPVIFPRFGAKPQGQQR